MIAPHPLSLTLKMMIKCALVILMLASCVDASTLLLESFEQVNTGSVNGQNNWVVESGVGDVQTSEVFDGAQALEVLSGSVSHSLTNSKSTIWIRFEVFITGAPDENPVVTDGSTSVAFFVNTNLNLTVYSNTTPVELAVPVATNVWHRFDVYCDYESMIWNLSMDGTTVAAGLPLYSDSTVIERVQISNNSSDSVYVDDLQIQDEEMTAQAPDSDSDGIPDWWEQKYFGSIIGCSAADESGNPGWTYLETYIAGISPILSEPFAFSHTGLCSLSWDAKSGRSYDVLWTTNLLAGFTPVASNLTNQTEFNDISSNTNLPSGFYKLQVRIEP